MGANVALSGAMAATSQTMGEMNKIMRPEKIAGDMRAFAQANMKMEMTDEMSMSADHISWSRKLMIWLFFFAVNETLDDMLEDSGDEEETNGIVNQVLDEIGIEISGKVMINFIPVNTDYLPSPCCSINCLPIFRCPMHHLQSRIALVRHQN